jgi:molecular chaperone DnaK (HSP70)
LQHARLYATQTVTHDDHDDDPGIGVGIDLGTTNSAIAYLDEVTNEPCIIEIPHNGRTMPSVVVLLEKEESPIVGKEAMEWERQHQETAYRHIKRIMGTSAQFLSTETRQVVPHLVSSKVQDGSSKGKKKHKPPSLERQIQAAKEDPAMLHPLTKDYTALISPETISSCILQKLLQTASEHTGRCISRAVIGVPAYFNDAQREATIRAAKACGIEKVKLLNEPEAAALAYGVGKDNDNEKINQDELVLVFDLGGGTYDVSVLLIEQGLTEIVCTSGNAQLGGTNFDAKIAKYLSSKVVRGFSKSQEAADMILRTAECIRIYLSNNQVTELALPSTEEGWVQLDDPKDVILPKGSKESLQQDDTDPRVFFQLSRKDMERICAEEFQDLLRPIREVAIMAGALLPGDARPGAADSAVEIDAAFADFYNDNDNSNTESNGMSASMQEVLKAAENELNLKSAKKAQQKGRKKAREVAKQERKYRAESRKAQETQPVPKVQADGISGRPLSRIVLVGGATRMPTIGKIISSLTGVVPQRTVDPDEAVALGCAVHVGVLDGKDEMGVVLSPMQAALLRAVVEKERREGQLDDFFIDDDEEDFASVEYL